MGLIVTELGADLMKVLRRPLGEEDLCSEETLLPQEVTAYFPKADLQTISSCSSKWLHPKYDPGIVETHLKRQLNILKCLFVLILYAFFVLNLFF